MSRRLLAVAILLLPYRLAGASPLDPRLPAAQRAAEARGYVDADLPLQPVPARANELVGASRGVRRVRPLRWLAASKPTGALSGKVIYLSPGHGWTYTSANGWGTQRPNTHGIVEDLSNGDGIAQFLVPLLLAAGAEVVPVRELDPNPNLAIVDNDDAGGAYKESGDAGAFLDSTLAGWGRPTLPLTGDVNPFSLGTNRLMRVSTSETARATFTFDVPESGYYYVYISYSMFSARASDAEVMVLHPGGNTTYLVDQRRRGGTWVMLGRHYFDKGSDSNKGAVVITNKSADADANVSLDAVRIGGGAGLIDRGGGTSGYARADECSRYHAQWAGAPTSVYDNSTSNDRTDDVATRSRFADWAHEPGEDAIYISHHSNASGAAGAGRGTVTYLYGTNAPDGSLTPDSRAVALGSLDLAKAVQNEIVVDVRAAFDPSWKDRGVNSAYFGEVNPNHQDEMASILIETAFHDNVEDAAFLREAGFRAVVARAIYKATVRFFAQRDSAPVRLAPLPPRAAMLRQDGAGKLTVSFDAPPSSADSADPASSYRVYVSRHGYAFDEGTDTGGKTELTLQNVAPGDLVFVRVTALNDGGESLPTRTLAARVAGAGKRPSTLLVAGFPRIDSALNVKRDYPGLDTVDRLLLDQINNGTYLVQHARALAAAGVAFDSAVDEAIRGGAADSALDDYKLLVWQAGHGYDDAQPLSSASAAKLVGAAQGGLSLWLSGSAVGRRLAAGDANHTQLLAALLADSSTGDGTLAVSAAPGALLDGLADFTLAGKDALPYDTGTPEVLAAASGSTVIARYVGSDSPAAVAGKSGDRCGVLLGFPLENVNEPTARETLVKRIADYCGAESTPAGDAGPGDGGPAGGDGDGGGGDDGGGCGCHTATPAGSGTLAVLLLVSLLALLRRRGIVAALLAALLALGGSGCASSAKPASGSAAGPGKSAAAGAARATSPRPLEDGPGPMLWRVTSPRGTSALLLGTMHLGIEAKRDLPAFVFKAFNAAKQVAFEADVRTINPIELIKLARLRGPPTLDKRLGPEAWAKLTKLLAGKLPPVVMAQLEPWLIVVMLVAKVVPRTTPMDLALMKDAMVNKQRLVFLEHWKEQLGMMDKVIKAEHLAKLLDHTAEQRTLFNKMATLYRAGQAKQMRALLDEEPDWSRGDADKAHELMLLRRNQRWLPKVRRMIGDNDAFIAVGLAHLIGKDNLLDMLRARGYKVARVRR